MDTGAFEVADDTLAASQRLLARHPDAQIWCVRIGHPAVHRFGPRVRVAPRMMTGVVNADLEPLLRLTVRDAGGQPHDVEAVIDTGFNGFLTLPSCADRRCWGCRGRAANKDCALEPPAI